jgi:hypothetical protein
MEYSRLRFAAMLISTVGCFVVILLWYLAYRNGYQAMIHSIINRSRCGWNLTGEVVVDDIRLASMRMHDELGKGRVELPPPTARPDTLADFVERWKGKTCYSEFVDDCIALVTWSEYYWPPNHRIDGVDGWSVKFCENMGRQGEYSDLDIQFNSSFYARATAARNSEMQCLLKNRVGDPPCCYQLATSRGTRNYICLFTDDYSFDNVYGYIADEDKRHVTNLSRRQISFMLNFYLRNQNYTIVNDL